MKQAHDYRKYNIRLTSADWQRGSSRVTSINKNDACHVDISPVIIPMEDCIISF